MSDDTEKTLLPLLSTTSYSKALLELCQRIRTTQSKEERGQLMIQLAARFYREHDITNDKFSDDYHNFFEDYERAQLAFQQAALRLARQALSEVQETLEANDVSLDDVVGAAKTAAN